MSGEIMLFFLCLLYLKYVVSLNISTVSITTLNQYLAVNSQQLPEIPKKGPEYPKMDSKARNRKQQEARNGLISTINQNQILELNILLNDQVETAKKGQSLLTSPSTLLYLWCSQLPPFLNRIDLQCSFNSAVYSHDVTITDGLTDVRHSLLNTIQLLLYIFS